MRNARLRLHFVPAFAAWVLTILIVTVVECGMAIAADGDETEGDEWPSHRYQPLPGFSRMPYLQQSTPESMAIVWRTTEAMTPVVRFGTDLKKLDRTCEGEKVIIKRRLKDSLPIPGPPPKSTALPLFTAPDNTWQYEAMIDGLDASTRYYYAIYDGDERLTPEDQSYYLETHPKVGSEDELLFWVVGDSGTGELRQQEVHRAMVDYVAYNNLDLDLYVHVGDMAYGSGKDDEFQEHFFEMYDPTLRNTPCWPAMGNHEGHTSKGKYGIGPYYDCYICPSKGEAGGEPSGTEAYYAFDYGNVHFVVLDSFDLDRRPDGAMAEWLRADLEKATADWIVAFWHHPPYTKGSHDSDKEEELIEMRRHIVPILESGGVDLCLTGHSHIYERSMLMDGAYETPTNTEDVILDDGDGDPNSDGAYRKSEGLTPNSGAIQIVAGHGGAKLSRKGTMPIMKRIMLENGSVLVRIKGDTLIGTMINHKGYERDVFSVVKRGVVAPIRIEQPWERPPYSNFELASYPWEGSSLSDGSTQLVEKHADDWQFLVGAHPPDNWVSPGFDASKWQTGKAGFGFGDRDDNTELPDMRGKFTTLYLRHELKVDNPQDVKDLVLAAAYDDGFIAYLNGTEFARANVTSGAGPTAVVDFSREADEKFQMFRMRRVRDAFVYDSPNILAIEAHNRSLSSDDFTIDPFVALLAPRQVKPKRVPSLYEFVTGLNEKWHYLAGSDPEPNWADEEFNDSSWPLGLIGIGYADGDDRTVLEDMKDQYSRVYMRTSFKVAEGQALETLGLIIRYDDAFIAYINGNEAVRVGVEYGRGAGAKGIESHEASDKKDSEEYYDFFSLGHMADHLNIDGPNVIAIEGHNDSLDSSDFTLDPMLVFNGDESRPLPLKYEALIPEHAEWRYVAKKDGAPENGWEKIDFETSDWDTGESGFGYGNNADARTKLDDMRDNYRVVYARKTFDLDDLKDAPKAGLAIRFDDAFIAFLNGKEILRRGVGKDRGEKASEFTGKKEISKDFEYFPLSSMKDYFVEGQNVLAIEGHNQDASSSDFVLDAFLLITE